MVVVVVRCALQALQEAPPEVAKELAKAENEAIVTGCICIITRRFEAAGRAFQQRFEKKSEESQSAKPRKQQSSSIPTEEDDDNSGDQDGVDWEARVKARRDARKRAAAAASQGGGSSRLKKLAEGPNLYGVLGLTDGCSVEEIKKAYRRLALEYHPDKVGTSEELKEKFLLIQEAYEVLSDEGLRLRYDSSLPFDESIPSASQTNAENFYSQFEPVFLRNARWSARKPVPKLGTPETPFNEVQRFYDFWHSFETCRDFSANDEYDLAEAECREERRWMERQNQRTRKKCQREERERINKLVDLAYSLDPRIKAEKEAQRQAKRDQREMRKKEQLARLEAQRAEEKRKEDEERHRKEQEQRQAQAQLEERQKKKVALKRQRQILRSKIALTQNNNTEVADFLCLKLSYDELVKLNESLALKSDIAELSAEIQSHYECLKEREPKMVVTSPVIVEQQPKSQNKKDVAVNGSKWTAEELNLLARALQKYPRGTAQRWKLVSDMLGTKDVEEVIQQTRVLAEGSLKKNQAAPIPVAKPPVSQPAQAATVTVWTAEDQRVRDRLA